MFWSPARSPMALTLVIIVKIWQLKRYGVSSIYIRVVSDFLIGVSEMGGSQRQGCLNRVLSKTPPPISAQNL